MNFPHGVSADDLSRIVSDLKSGRHVTVITNNDAALRAELFLFGVPTTNLYTMTHRSTRA